MTTTKNLGDLIDPQADPQHTALIGLDDNPSTTVAQLKYTYADVDDIARGVAQALRAASYQPGERIAILAANSVRYIASVLGIMRAGLIAVPVNFKFPPALIAYVLKDSGARLVLHDQARALAVPNDITGIALDTAAFDAWRQPGNAPSYPPDAEDTALMLYTSGSTGKPKGVRLSHAGQWWTVQTRQFATSLSSERALIAAPLYHMNALALAFLSLASHATTVLLPQFTAAAYINAIGTYRCTWLTAVPPMIAMMLREHDLLARTDLSSVNVIRMGSAPVSASLLTQIHALFPAARVINAYGTTEGGPVVFGPHPDGLPAPRLSVGYPHPSVSLQLMPGPNDGPDQGILTLRSPGLMQGYHQRPDLTAPFTPEGHYITGDVFRRDENGFYYFVGRRDDMFVSGGENIYPGEVEKMLEQHPAVQQAAVVPIEDDIKGTKPVAFIVLRAGQQATTQEIKTYALAHAPAYQHPRQVWFIDALPLASTNKIDRHQLVAEANQRLKQDGHHAY